MSPQRPNLIYILADDMGFGDVGCLNPDSKIPTPNLDRLAAGGMRFTDAHASSAVCTPSRYSILTGRYNWRSQLKQHVLDGYSPHLIEPGRLTVASFLKNHGYQTACIGKWHLGWDWPRDAAGEVDFSRPISNGPTAVGFDHFFGISASLDMQPYVWVEDDTPTAIPDHETENPDAMGFWRKGPTAPDFQHDTVLDETADRACRWIIDAAAKGDPFFLYFPITAPHTPILPAPEFQGRSNLNAYADFCLHIDALVGRLLQALDDTGQAENTIVIFTSDNGCSPRADFPALARRGHHPSYHFRGAKADIYEGGHRIPLLIRWPQGIAPDSTCTETVCLTDLFRTLSEILDDPLPDNGGEDSVSNLPAWQGSNLPAPLREFTVSHSINGSFCIRKQRWKLEMCPGSGGWSSPTPGPECDGLPPIQLYDLQTDIGETTNVQADHPDIVQELRDQLTHIIRQGRSTPGKPQNNDGPNHWPQLWWFQ